MFNVKKDRNEILLELFKSKEKTNVLGFYFNNEDKLITTVVKKISVTEFPEPVIYLNEFDLHGYPLAKHQFSLSDIKGVIPFNTLYDDPVYIRIREMKRRMNETIAA